MEMMLDSFIESCMFTEEIKETGLVVVIFEGVVGSMERTDYGKVWINVCRVMQ